MDYGKYQFNHINPTLPPVMKDCAEHLVTYIEDRILGWNEDTQEASESFTRFVDGLNSLTLEYTNNHTWLVSRKGWQRWSNDHFGNLEEADLKVHIIDTKSPTYVLMRWMLENNMSYMLPKILASQVVHSSKENKDLFIYVTEKSLASGRVKKKKEFDRRDWNIRNNHCDPIQYTVLRVFERIIDAEESPDQKVSDIVTRIHQFIKEDGSIEISRFDLYKQVNKYVRDLIELRKQTKNVFSLTMYSNTYEQRRDGTLIAGRFVGRGDELFEKDEVKPNDLYQLHPVLCHGYGEVYQVGTMYFGTTNHKFAPKTLAPAPKTLRQLAYEIYGA